MIQVSRLAEARALYEEICLIQKKDMASWNKLAAIYGYLGDFKNAEKCCRHVIKYSPNSVQAYDNLGAALQNTNKLKEASKYHKKALTLNPSYYPAYFNIGNIYRKAGDYTNAINNYKRALKINPGFTNAAYNLANIYLDNHKYNEVIDLLKPITDANESSSTISTCLARAYIGLNNLAIARVTLESALKSNNSDAFAHYYLAEVLHNVSDYQEAEIHYRLAIKYKKDFYRAMGALGSILRKQGKFDEAIEVLRSLINVGPEKTDAISMLSVVYEHKGMHDEALQCLSPLIVSNKVETNIALAFARISQHTDNVTKAITLLENALVENTVDNFQKTQLHFQLARLYDTNGEFDKAFKNYHIANSLSPCSYDTQKATDEIDNIIQTYTPDFMASAPRILDSSDKPVFIIGMPRSGTSLVEQILSSHPDIAGAGELNTIQSMVYRLNDDIEIEGKYPNCMNSLDVTTLQQMARQYLDELEKTSVNMARITDKMPHNFLHLGLIEILFPGARVIHCKRDPRDTCLSCYFQDFGYRHQYSTNLSSLGHYYNLYLKLMEHWKKTAKIKFMEINYEDLVDSQEHSSRSLVEFCGLNWDEQCMKFHENKRIVTTISYDQVRRPLYSTSMGRWRNYENHIPDLLEALDSSVYHAYKA